MLTYITFEWLIRAVPKPTSLELMGGLSMIVISLGYDVLVVIGFYHLIS